MNHFWFIYNSYILVSSTSKEPPSSVTGWPRASGARDSAGEGECSKRDHLAKNQLTPPTQFRHIHVRNKDTSATAKPSNRDRICRSRQTHNKQNQPQFIRDDSMRISIMAGWFDLAMRVVSGEAESHTKCYANRGVAHDLDCVERRAQEISATLFVASQPRPH